MRPSLKVEDFDPLSLAADQLRHNGFGLVPVVHGDRLVGAITELSLGRVLGDGAELTDPIDAAIVPMPKIRNYESGAEALRRCVDEQLQLIAVVDDADLLLGLVGPSDLIPRRHRSIKPPVIGGMATPFGVYLTSGNVSGGAPKYALITTGMSMSAILIAATFGVQAFVDHFLPRTWNPNWTLAVGHFLAYTGFLALMRLLPLSGIHAAEHMVVHAIERDADLVPSVVERMPRVHPRCGTNFVAAISLFSSVYFVEWIGFEEIRLVAAIIVTMMFWRTFGSFLQSVFTTRPPNAKQLESGIFAGKDLLKKYAVANYVEAKPWVRVWNSGILHVISGAVITTSLFYFICQMLGYQIPLY